MKHCDMITARLTVVLALAFGVLCLQPLSSSAEQEGDFTYSVDNGKATITAYTGLGLFHVDIPSSLGGYPVVAIGDAAFAFRDSLPSVSIPNSVTNIGYDAFYSCWGLTHLSIPDSVTVIRDTAFTDCTGLIVITLGGGVLSIGEYPFAGCTSLTHINVSPVNPHYSSSDGVLYDGTMTTLVRYPEGKGGEYAIPEGTTDFSNNAFYGCDNLGGLTLPSTVVSNNVHIFKGCTGLQYIDVAASNEAFASIEGVLVDKLATTLVLYPNSKTNNYMIPLGITTIGESAFASCSGLTDVAIPNTVTNIHRYAFRFCSSLKSITIPESVAYIGESAFFSCSALGSATILAGVTDIPPYMFSSCSSLTNVLLGETVQTVENNAFQYCGELLDIGLGQNVSTLGYRSFYSCENLVRLVLPASVSSISDQAFQSCTSLARFYCTGNAPTYGSRVFRYANDVTVYYLPGSTGWTSTFALRPTALWNPTFDDLSFHADGLTCVVTGTMDIPISLEASDELLDAEWILLSTTNLTDGRIDLDDGGATNLPVRFYRIVGP